MKSGFYKIRSSPESDPPPAPTPFPIKIVTDEPTMSDASSQSNAPREPSGKRNDDFYPAWEKFLAVEPKRAKKLSRKARELAAEKRAVANSSGDGLAVKENAARSWEQAAKECRAKVDAIVAECERLNEKYHDRDFNLEGGPNCLQSLNGKYPEEVDKGDPPPWVKRVEDIFEKPQFFIDGAAANDVHQGSNGDCWFLAACMAIAAKGELVEKLCVARNEKVGVYGFVFFRDGEWISEVIDDKLFLKVGDDDYLRIVRDWDREKKQGSSVEYEDDKLKELLQKGGTALYFGHCNSNETWLPLIEKAYAKAHGDYAAIEGGWASEGTEDLTGGVAVCINPESIMDKEKFWKEQLLNVNKKYLFGGGSRNGVDVKGVVGGHAYAVLEAFEEGDLRLLKVRNPWGSGEWEGDWSDGSKLWTAEMMTKLKHTFGDDGVFWISYKDFLKHFDQINRVRLFDEGWSVSQQWTCVSVPWTVDYLDTSFEFTVTQKGPVVVVLCQPDDRYFYGLVGRYIHSLHFRLYKEDDDSHYIVRSMHSSGNDSIFTRSVSAEVDLEPGTYRVVFKVTCVRAQQASTAEEVIYKIADSRKEKLLHVGRRFDYAQSKGNLKAMEEKQRREKKEQKQQKQINGLKKVRALNKQERERARLRKKRVDDAMKEKRKETKAKQKEKKESKKAAKGDVSSTDAQPSVENSEKDAKSVVSSEEPVEVSKADAQEEGKEPPATIETATAEKEEPKPTASEDQKPKPESSEDAATQTTDDVKAEAKETKSEEQQDPSKSLPEDLSNLTLTEPSTTKTPISPLSTKDDNASSSESETDSDSTVSPLEELADDDFDWDSDIDAPLFSSSDEDSPSSSSKRGKSSKNGIFGDDPWNAMCVLGLRVYSQCKDLKVVVKQGGDETDEEDEE